MTIAIVLFLWILIDFKRACTCCQLKGSRPEATTASPPVSKPRDRPEVPRLRSLNGVGDRPAPSDAVFGWTVVPTEVVSGERRGAFGALEVLGVLRIAVVRPASGALKVTVAVR